MTENPEKRPRISPRKYPLLEDCDCQKCKDFEKELEELNRYLYEGE